MKAKPNVMILRTEGTNCDEEAFFAFQLAGGNSEYVHVNELRNKSKKLSWLGKNLFSMLAPSMSG